MTNERWEKLKATTWFRAEQDEVTAYVEKLRGGSKFPTCTCGASAVTVGLSGLARHASDCDLSNLQHCAWGNWPAASE